MLLVLVSVSVLFSFSKCLDDTSINFNVATFSERSAHPIGYVIFFIFRKTSPCNEDPLTPHFYIVKLGFTGVFIFSYFCSKHRLWVLVRTASLRRF